jgi:tetratricopeptide (TPR) repeat protein
MNIIAFKELMHYKNTNMRSILKIVFVAGLFLSVPSCDFLEVETVGRTTMPNFFSDVAGLKAGLSGSYSRMFDYYSSEFYKYPEVAGNMVDLDMISSDVEMVDQFNFTSDPEQEVGAVGYIWRKILVALANVNNVLEYAPPLINAFPNQKEEIELVQAQALFLRALCHFDLYRVYAQPYNYTADASHLGVPVLLMTPGPDDLPSRATAKQVFDQIIKDLQDAEALFGNRPMRDAYHVSKKAVWALLSRVYLYKEDWDNAIVYASKVIDQSSLAYDDDYLAMYNNLIAGEEAILRLGGVLKSKSLGIFFSSEKPLVMAADTLLSLYTDAGDIRLRLFAPDTNNELKITTKYRIKVGYTSEQERYDPFILRVSEAYLNRAEAYARNSDLTNASNDLKAIVGRAVSKSASEVQLVYANKDELLLLIKKERVKELCFEGHNFFDIVRYNDDLVRSVTTTSNIQYLSYPNDLFVLPIPQSELNANTKMQGNPTVNG